VSIASSDYVGFGMAAGHKYINDKFDENAKQRVRSTLYIPSKMNGCVIVMERQNLLKSLSVYLLCWGVVFMTSILNILYNIGWCSRR
jgi:hypothetical protein